MSDEEAMRWLDEQWPYPMQDDNRWHPDNGGHIFARRDSQGRENLDYPRICHRSGCGQSYSAWAGDPCDHIGPWQGPRRPTFADYAAVVRELMAARWSRTPSELIDARQTLPCRRLTYRMARVLDPDRARLGRRWCDVEESPRRGSAGCRSRS